MFVIRDASPGDADELSRVAIETFQEGWGGIIGEQAAREYSAEHLTAGRLSAEIKDRDTHYFALLTDQVSGAIIGYGKLILTRPPHDSIRGGRPVLLQRLYLSASGRGTGAADALLTACECEALRLGFDTLWLECDPRNVRAWRFYEKRGFVARGGAIYHYPRGYNDKIRVMERLIRQDYDSNDANG